MDAGQSGEAGNLGAKVPGGAGIYRTGLNRLNAKYQLAFRDCAGRQAGPRGLF
jgi:hypothetical protein